MRCGDLDGHVILEKCQYRMAQSASERPATFRSGLASPHAFLSVGKLTETVYFGDRGSAV